jgi:hypothetical protein
MNPRWNFLGPLKSLGPLFKWSLGALVVVFLMSFILGLWFDGLSRENSFSAPPPLKGMALGLFSEESTHPYSQGIQEIQSLGANAVLLMVPWYQKDIYQNKMEPRFGWGADHITLPDERLRKLIRKAHQSGLKILLMPYLRFDQRGPKEWRGVLKPQNFNQWAIAYQNFILHYAKIAGEEGVDFFSVGSELGSLENKKNFWKKLISKVRKAYPGKLLYSSNWDHYQYPVFWNQLDYIGITSYHRLTEKLPPTLGRLRLSWDEFKKNILQFQKKFPDKKIIITEVGYPSIRGASKDPWNYFADEPVDLEEQALCYQAFIEAWNNTPQLEGVFWWVWFGDGGPQDKTYTPKGKPAQRLVHRWYKSLKI